MNTRTRLHNKWHRELEAYWKGRRIESCEVRFEGCFGTYGLAPAHSVRRRFIDTKEKYFEVVAACQNCHIILDQKMSPDDCLTTVQKIIAKRG